VANTPYIGTLGQILHCPHVRCIEHPSPWIPGNGCSEPYFLETGGSSTYQGHACFELAF
jgi:hypothetical protein